MLQRAASNAYSWWWASHIRTKQSKWLEQNLQDMEEKVQTVLKLIEEDGDSFARRAEMYYKKRPELIHFVEESYRAYRALAERYDHISTELQNANNTIASVFPDQVQFMEDDEDDGSPRYPKKMPEASKNVPKVPKIPKEVKGFFSSAKNKLQPKKSVKVASSHNALKSGLSKTDGLKEIDKLQKQILSLQTEKEFVKSSYQGGLAKYWEIDQQIRELQEKVCTLQDEFGGGTVIEDDEARTLMASAALKSCQETLDKLQEKQEKSAEETGVERKRIDDARDKLNSLKNEFLNIGANDEPKKAEDGESRSSDKEAGIGAKEKQNLEMLREKIKEHFKAGSNSSITVSELAEKIDELVTKVVSLETAVSSQTALIERLRTETDELHAGIQTLEDDKAPLISGKSDLSEQLREMEDKLQGLEDLNQSVEEQNNNLQAHFTEARCNLDHLSEKMHDVKPDEEVQQVQEKPVIKFKSQEKFRGHGGGNIEERVRAWEKSHGKFEGQESSKTAEEAAEEIKKKKKDKKPKKLKFFSQKEEKVSETAKKEEKVSESSPKKEEAIADSSQKDQKFTVSSEKKDGNDSDSLQEKEGQVSDSLQKIEENVGGSKSKMEKFASSRMEKIATDSSSQKREETAADTSNKKDGTVADSSSQKIEETPADSLSQERAETAADFSSQKREETAADSSERQKQIVTGSLHKEDEEVSDSLKEKEEKFSDITEKMEETAADSSQKRGETAAEVSLPTEIKKPEEEPNNSCNVTENVVDNKTEEDQEIKENDLSTSNRTADENASQPQTISDPAASPEKSDGQKVEEKPQRRRSRRTVGELLGVRGLEMLSDDDNEEPDWKQLYLNGLDNREKVLLNEYTTVLRNYKDIKKKLTETENKNSESDFDTMVQIRELRNSNARKEEQIRYLRQKLSLLQAGLGEDNESEKSTMTESPLTEKESADDFPLSLMEQPDTTSPIEEKFRMDIDELLEENLDFWLRFSTTFGQIQKFETEVQDLQSEMQKLEEKKKKYAKEGSSSAKYYLKSDAKPLYKHLREIHTELTVWIEKSMLLKDELKGRFASLCEIQEGITTALKESAEDDDIKFTSYQAAKFQGEILNMKQENNKVADELQAGLDHVTTLQLDVEKTLARLNDEFKLSGSKNQSNIQLQHSESRSRVPLRSFIFGTKPKKQKHSIFACVHPALQKKYNGLKLGSSM